MKFIRYDRHAKRRMKERVTLLRDSANTVRHVYCFTKLNKVTRHSKTGKRQSTWVVIYSKDTDQ